MKYLIALFLFVSPGFACEHRSSFLHKIPYPTILGICLVGALIFTFRAVSAGLIILNLCLAR